MQRAQLTQVGRQRSLISAQACAAFAHKFLQTSRLVISPAHLLATAYGEAQLVPSARHCRASPCCVAPLYAFAYTSPCQQRSACHTARRCRVTVAAHGQRDAMNEQPDVPDTAPAKGPPGEASSGDITGMSRTPAATPPQRPRFAVPGQLIILTVALLWGTNPPALRYLYASDGTCFPDALPRNFLPFLLIRFRRT